MATRPYKRIPGQGRSLMNHTTLWEAEDHLLMVQSHVVSETYRRLFYRDIQAIVLCKTVRGLIMNIVLGLFTAAFAIPALLTEGGVAISLGITAGLFLLITVINIVKGPTCRCTLRTTVQTQPMPSLRRLRSARKAIAIIQQRVEAAQQQAAPQ